MKRSVLVLVSMAVMSGFASAASAQQAKIGVVDTNRLMAEAPQAVTAIETIRKEFEPREREVQAMGTALQTREERLRRDAATMTDAQRTSASTELERGYRDFQIKQGELQDDFNARRNEELSKLNSVLLDSVQSYARSNSYDLIVADGVLFATPALDITNSVLEALKARGNAPAAAPRP